MGKNNPKKPFKTYNQQLKILRDRNLIIKNGSKAILVLKRDNYYNIINGYKDIFLETGGENEKYYNGTKFEHIVALSNFDKEIRHLFLYHILSFENLIKTKISYYHTKEFNEIFNYLDVNNFSGEASEVTKLISVISREIEKYTNMDKSRKYKAKDNKNAFSHYIEKHGELPLWVLFQKSTFGTSGYFFKSLQDNIKDKICDELNKEYSKLYKVRNFNEITPDFLKNVIHFINSYKNVCAHNERFYNCSFQKKSFKIDYSKYGVNREFRGTVFDLLAILKLFLLKQNFDSLKRKFKKHLEKLETELSDNPEAFKKIKTSRLKLPLDWEYILNIIWK